MKKLALALAIALTTTSALAQPKTTPPINGLAQWSADDIAAAQALATSVPGLQDPVGAACWGSFSGLVGLLKAHPLPLTLKAATDFEALRLTAISLNQICANPNCGQMWTDLQNAQASLSIVPLPFSMQSLCSRVVVIGSSPASVQPVPLVSAPTAVSK